MARKYTVEEIDQMRKSIEWSYPSGVSYYPEQRAAEVESKLRTYMQNDTSPEELAEMARRRSEIEAAAQQQREVLFREMRAAAPPPRVLSSKEDVIDEWFQTCVARYAGASVEARELFDGFSGRTLKRFANQHAPDGVHITQKDMERYLDAKKVRSRSAMFAKRYDGIRHVIHGNVRSGNYGT